jgi:hypothetical protein
MKTVSVGVSKLKSMRIKDFKELDSVLLIEEFENKPITAIVPYEYYMKMQEIILWADNEFRQYAQGTNKEAKNA